MADKLALVRMWCKVHQNIVDDVRNYPTAIRVTFDNKGDAHRFKLNALEDIDLAFLEDFHIRHNPITGKWTVWIKVE